MKINNIHINAFGVLKNIDYDFGKNVSTICQQNGYGKTTLTIFIKSMFYGMPQTGRNKGYAKERSKYQPWEGGSYGGSLSFSVEKREYLMTRTFGKTPDSDTFELVDLKSGLKANDYTKNIGEELFGVGAETFEISAFFPQNNLISGVNDEIRAGLTGVNKFENDLDSVSQATKNISAKMTVLRAQCPKQVALDSLKAGIENGQAQFASMQKKLEELSKQCCDKEIMLAETETELKKIKASKKANDELKKYYEDQTLNLKSNCLARDRLLAQKASMKEVLSQKKVTKEKPKINLFILGLVLTTCTVISSIMAGFMPPMRLLFIILAIVFFIGAITSLGFAFNLQSKKESSAISCNMSDYLKIEKDIDELNDAIQAFEKILDSAPQLEYEQNLSDIQETFYSLDKSLSLLKQEKRLLEGETIKLDKYILEMQDDYERLLSNKIEISYNLNMLESAKQYLLKAKENVSLRFIQPMQENFDNVLARIVSDKLKMDIDLNINKMTDAGLKESEYLSQGYQDIVSICKRFALLDKIYLKHKPFIILDDPFVNLDDEKLDAAKKLVLEFGEKYQILYVCSHSRLII